MLFSNRFTCTQLKDYFKVLVMAMLPHSSHVFSPKMLIPCDSAWTALRLHGTALNMYETKQLGEHLLGNYCVPCTMLGTVRYITDVHNSTLILRSAQQSNCEMTPTKKE